MRKQLSLAIFVWIIRLAIRFIPKDCTKTWKWITEMPFEK